MMGAFALFAYNFNIDQQSAVHCNEVATEFKTLMTPLSPTVDIVPMDDTVVGQADVVVRNESVNIRGDLYIGLLEVPTLNLSLPIHMDLSESKLHSAPCVYMGTLANNDLVIAGHNYRAHFWYLKNLNVGDTMTITNPNGFVYRYSVSQIEMLHQSQVAVLEDRDKWDLTLFTCNYPDSTYRIVVRCNRI